MDTQKKDYLSQPPFQLGVAMEYVQNWYEWLAIMEHAFFFFFTFFLLDEI
jgi:hypothetical protein